MLDLTYPFIIPTAKMWFKAMDFRFQMSGFEAIPRKGGALLAVNHVSYVDFIMAGWPGERRGRYTRFMAKRETFDHPFVGPFMKSFHHISVDRADGQGSADEAVRYLKKGELVGIFPEATISRSFEIKEIKTGATRIAAAAGVPLIPVIVWGTQRVVTKDHPRDLSRHKTIAINTGEPMHPTGENSLAETEELRRRMQELLAKTIEEYPADEQPPGSWWLPASYGGSAPTPEQARQLDSDELRARLAKKRAKAAAQKAKG